MNETYWTPNHYHCAPYGTSTVHGMACIRVQPSESEHSNDKQARTEMEAVNYWKKRVEREVGDDLTQIYPKEVRR